MPKIEQFDAGNLALRPSETGVEARAGTARRVGTFFNQQAGAEEMLASATSRLAGDTRALGAETQQVGSAQQRLGSEQQRLGSETAQLGSEEGAALSNVGRRIGSAVDVAGEAAVKFMDNRQISHGESAFADLMLGATQDWNDTVKNADPNDPTVAAKFMTALDQRLDAFKENGFYTENAQKWAETKTNALRQHFLEKATADMSTLAGQAAKVNTEQTVNKLSATVHGDPSSLDFALASFDHSTAALVGSSPNLSGTQATAVRNEITQKGKESIVKAAAIGYIEKTASMPAWATDPKYAPYINGAELKMFEKAAQTQAKTNQLQDKQLQLYQRQLDTQAVHAGANKIMTDNVSVDDNGHAVIKPQFFKQALDLAKQFPNAPNAQETVRTLFNWGEAQQNAERKVITDPATKQELTDRMFSADNPTSEIDLMKAEVAGKLSRDDFNSMHQLWSTLNQASLKGEQWKTTLAAAKDQLIISWPGKMPGEKDDTGIANYSKFVQSFIPQYLSAVRTNTLKPNALDTRDPTSLISQAMQPFKRSPAQAMQDHIRANGGVGAPPAAPTALPPVTERVKEKVYDTPSGPKKWTGTGWINP